MASAWNNHLKSLDSIALERVQHMMLPSEIELLSLDIISHANGKHLVSIEQSPIFFCFHVTGLGHSKITHSSKRKEASVVKPNKVIISYIPHANCEVTLMERQHYRILNLYISPQQLYSQLGGKLDIAPVEIQKIIEGTFCKPYFIAYDMSPQTRMIIDQILNSPYEGALKDLFLEHKSMELILRQFYELQDGGGYNDYSRIGSGDIDHIQAAKTILFENLENPPSLIDLAQRVGINSTKLKKGFRQVFGTTAYAMVRQERIRRACELLDQGALNIAEIGHQLGFSDASHFIRVFTKYHGVTPGKYSKIL